MANEAAPVPGAEGIADDDEEDCEDCKKEKDESVGQSYDEFFDEDEKKALDKLAEDFPDIVPPKDGRYYVRSVKKNQRARKRWKKIKPAGSWDHPHPIKAGGCPVHQKPVDTSDPKKKKAEEEKQKIVNKALSRAVKAASGAKGA